MATIPGRGQHAAPKRLFKSPMPYGIFAVLSAVIALFLICVATFALSWSGRAILFTVAGVCLVEALQLGYTALKYRRTPVRR